MFSRKNCTVCNMGKYFDLKLDKLFKYFCAKTADVKGSSLEI